MLADRELPQEKAAICSANLGSQPQGAISPKKPAPMSDEPLVHGTFVKVCGITILQLETLVDLYKPLAHDLESRNLAKNEQVVQLEPRHPGICMMI